MSTSNNETAAKKIMHACMHEYSKKNWQVYVIEFIGIVSVDAGRRKKGRRRRF